MKKHVVQMTDTEKKLLKEAIRMSLNKRQPITLSGHCKDRMKEKRITLHDLLSVIKYYDLIEYHLREFEDGNTDKRVVIRGKKDYDGNNICISYSIDRKRIVTAYVNSNEDNHSTLDLNNYSEKVLISL